MPPDTTSEGSLYLIYRIIVCYFSNFYFPMQSINLIDNQLVKSFVVQIWFRKNGYHLSLNRTEFESESTNANIGKNLQTVKESGQALSER